MFNSLRPVVVNSKKSGSTQEHHNARDVVLHVVFGVPFLRCAFNQLFTAVLCVLLSLVKKLNCFGHLWDLYLVRDAIGADQNGSVFESVTRNDAYCRRGDDAA